MAGDFNNDGRLDLAVANIGSNNVSIYLAISRETPFGGDEFRSPSFWAPLYLGRAFVDVWGFHLVHFSP
jgi:hypothetical protein